MMVKYAVRRRDSAGNLHPILRHPDDHVFESQAIAASDWSVMRNRFPGTDYVVTIIDSAGGERVAAQRLQD